MLRTDHRIWLFSYPLSFGNDSAKRIPVGRLHVRDDEPSTSRRTILESRSGSLSEDGGTSSGKAPRNVKRRSVQTTRPSLWFEYDDAWLSEGFALSHDLPLKDGPILPKKGKRLFALLEDVRLDPEVRFLVDEAQEKGVSLDWMLGVKPEEAAFTSLLEENSSLGALSAALEGDVKPLAPALLAKILSHRPALPVFQSQGDELLYAHHAAERNRAGKAELELLLSARTLPGRSPVYSVLVDKRPSVATFGQSSEPVHAALWQGFSLETARAVGIRTVTPTLRMLMGEPVLLRSRADRNEANRPYAALSAKALIAPKGSGLRKTITYSDIVDFLTREGAALFSISAKRASLPDVSALPDGYRIRTESPQAHRIAFAVPSPTVASVTCSGHSRTQCATAATADGLGSKTISTSSRLARRCVTSSVSSGSSIVKAGQRHASMPSFSARRSARRLLACPGRVRITGRC